MIRDSKLFCGCCNHEIPFVGKPCVRVLVELVKSGSDRHYCENCIGEVTDPNGRFAAHPNNQI